MSKTSRTRLTGLRKTRSRRPAVCAGVEWRDAMNERCWHLGTLAGLLAACGEPLAVETLEGVGHAIERDVAAMKALLGQLEGVS
jgi:hypothetical protein